MRSRIKIFLIWRSLNKKEVFNVNTICELKFFKFFIHTLEKLIQIFIF